MNYKAKEALDTLGALPGMYSVKEQVEQMIQFARISKLREKNGLKAERHSNHMVFTGNPGTGKTTAARLIGQAFAAMGILESDSEIPPFIEVHHTDVTSELVGKAEKNIREKFRDARGGVLFIDEVYTFLGKSEHRSSEKIVGCIVQMLEDMRESVICIVAGYPDETEEFLNYNPGLRSRFSNTICFTDYSIVDMMQIAEYMCSEREYKMTEEFQRCFELRMQQEMLLPNFANARTVRNIIEKAIKMQSMRVSHIASPTKQDLILLTGEDIRFQIVPKATEKEKLMNAIQEMQARLLQIELNEILSGK